MPESGKAALLDSALLVPVLDALLDVSGRSARHQNCHRDFAGQTIEVPPRIESSTAEA